MALFFMDYHLKVQEQESFKRYGRLLGNYWDIDSLENLFSEPDLRESHRKPQTEFFYPFSFLVNADFMDALRKSAGRKYGIAPPDWVKNAGDENFEDMFSWDAEDFVKFVGGVVGPRIPGKLRQS
jgi:hypothetical protein